MVVQERLVVSVEEAGKLLGISRTTAYECVRRGLIPALRISERRWIVPKAAIAQMLAQVKVPGTDASKAEEEGPGYPVSDK